MSRSLCPDSERATIAIFAAVLALMLPAAAGQIAVIVLAGVIGRRRSQGRCTAHFWVWCVLC
jgi:chromate transporter